VKKHRPNTANYTALGGGGGGGGGGRGGVGRKFYSAVNVIG